MSDAIHPDPRDVESRRNWLKLTTAAGGVAAVATAIPFVSTLAPSERAKAQGAAVEVDIADLAPGAMKTVEWRGKPVWVVRRTPEMLAQLEGHDQLLADPASERPQQPLYAQNATRSAKPEAFAPIWVVRPAPCRPAAATPVWRPTGPVATSVPATAAPSMGQGGCTRTSPPQPTWRSRRTATCRTRGS